MPKGIHTLADLYSRSISKIWKGSILEADTKKELNCDTFPENVHKILSILEDYKIGFGDKIIIKTTNTIASVVAMQAIWHKGAVVVPIKDNTTHEATLKIVQNCGAKAILWPQPNPKIQLINHTQDNISSPFKYNTTRNVSGSDLALIIYTSGSTGNPKGIMLTHNNVITALNSITDYLEISTDDKILCLSPLSFDYGLYQILFAYKENCSTVLNNSSTNPILIAKLIKQYGITMLPLVPVVAANIEKSLHLFPNYFNTLRKITNTGGHLPSNVIQGLRKKLSHVQIYAMYGLTESKRVFYLPPNDIDKKIGSVGIPMPGLEARVFETVRKGDKIFYQEANPYQVGMLYVRGSTLMQGYTDTRNDEIVQLIEGAYRDDVWLCTGDLFCTDEDGYFYFKGRKKELIKQAGYCIYPREIEDIVTQNPFVHLNVVISDTDELGNEIAHLFIQLCFDTKFNRASINNWLKEKIGPDHLPKKVSFVASIPVTANGKINKSVISANYKKASGDR